MDRLKNKIIVITGGSMGIGFAVAKKCAEESAKVILISRHREDLNKAIKELKGGNNTHIAYQLDVSNEENVEEFSKEIKKEFGYIDGLVNCAGIYGPIGRIDKISPEAFVEAININLFGTFFMCHYLIPLLMLSNRGKIINFSGGGASGPFPNYSAYAVSKIGIVRLTENLAIELKEYKIDVNAVAPGFVLTRLHQQTVEAGEKAGKEFFENTIKQIEKGGTPPEKAAELTLFLLSNDSDGISGKFISAAWDPWETKEFLDKLRTDKNFATLRRIDNKFFYEKSE